MSGAAPAKRMCPGCESAMQVFFAQGVEVDRCAFCGGLWFDGGELEQVLGHVVGYEPLEGVTKRRCATCMVTLAPVRIGPLPAERCGLCHSVYLDHGELAELAGGELPLTPAAAPSARADGSGAASGRERISFRCAGCGTEGDLDEGFATGRGMACSSCVGMLEQTPSTLGPSHIPGVSWRGGTSASMRGLQRDAGVRGGLDLGSVFGAVFGLFRSIR